MEEVQWDRQSFVPKTPPPRKEGSSILGPILFVLAISVAGGAGYLYIKNNGIPEIGIKPTSENAELMARLEEMNERLERLEKRLHVSPPARSASSQPSATAPASSGPPSRRAPAEPRVAPSVYASTQLSSPPPSSTPSQFAAPTLPNSSSRDLSALQGELESNREAWEATTNRLGDAVGELGDQRRELAGTQETLGQMQRDLERTYLAFDLRKNAERQRIGPVWMDLRSVDRKAQRFTMRVFFDDRWVEMKDRVLGERLEFYIRGVSHPIELVVSEIRQDQVLGHLGLPKQGVSR